MWSKWTHVGTASVEVACELLTIDVSKIGDFLQPNPVLYSLACEYAKQFHRRITSAYPPHGAWPTDLHVPFTDYCDLVVSMPQKVQEVIGQAALNQLPKSSSMKRGLGKLKDEVGCGKSIL